MFYTLGSYQVVNLTGFDVYASKDGNHNKMAGAKLVEPDGTTAFQFAIDSEAAKAKSSVEELLPITGQ